MEFKKTKPLISIITVVFDGELTLEKTILSVINQTYEHFEFLIIDGNSTDGTHEIIDKYKSSIDFVMIEKDNGIYDAMNKGLRYAKGEYLFYLNSGDIVYENTFKYIFKEEKKVFCFDVVYGNIINAGTNKVVKALPLNEIKQGMIFCHQAVLLKKEILEIFKFDTSYKIAADFNLFLKLYLANKSFYYFDINFGEYDDTGVSNKMFFKTINEYIQIIWKNAKTFRKPIEIIKYLNFKKKFIAYLVIINLIGDHKYSIIRSKLR